MHLTMLLFHFTDYKMTGSTPSPMNNIQDQIFPRFFSEPLSKASIKIFSVCYLSNSFLGGNVNISAVCATVYITMIFFLLLRAQACLRISQV